MKSRRTAGFTLSETLTTVLLLGIIFAAVGGGVVVLRNSYMAITEKADAQVLLSTAVAQISGDLHSATMSMKKEGIDNPFYYCSNRGVAIQYQESGDNGITVVTYDGESDSLVTKVASTKLVLAIKGFAYDAVSNTFSMTISVNKGTDTIESTSLTVRPFNTVVVQGS